MARQQFQGPPPRLETFEINRNSPQAVGLVAWYPTVDYAGSAPLRDRVGVLNGTRTGTTNLVVPSGVLGKMLTINSTNYWTVTDNAYLNFTGDCTFSFWWFSGAFNDSTDYGLWGKGTSFPNEEVQWYFYKPAFVATLDFCIGDGSETFYAAEFEDGPALQILTNKLYHCVARREGTVLNTFCNGWKNRTQTWSFGSGAIYISADNLLLGKASVGNGIGRLADLRIYNRALSDAECQALYQPATRWDLYLPVQRRRYYVMAEAAAAGKPVYAYAQQ
jgi:hypothetical protein